MPARESNDTGSLQGDTGRPSVNHDGVDSESESYEHSEALRLSTNGSDGPAPLTPLKHPAAGKASRPVPSASLILSPVQCVWIGRALSLSTTVVMVVYVAYTSWAGTSPENAIYGGLHACLECDSGLNWHILLFSIAVAVAMTESFYAYTPVLKLPLGPTWVHLAWQVIALILSAVAMAQVFAGYSGPTLFMFTTHDFVGLAVLALYVVEFFAGIALYFFLKNRLRPSTFTAVAFYHRLLGRYIILGFIYSCITGLADMQFMMVIASQPPYSSSTVTMSVASVLFFLLGGILLYQFTISPSYPMECK